MNIASGEFRGSSYDTNRLSTKNFLSIFKTCPLVNTSGNLSAPAVKYMIFMSKKKHHQCMRTKFTKILSDLGKS